ncbi:Hypothetical protein ERS027660_02033 [Mycobacterium tuberculosis]|nr:Hypothetical protein ERS024245_00005 [Mycobacterium tuberculosis]CKL82329.1 Hypothetical protein ERS013334_01555 [Mycobacterium tuberculosis]CKN02732.1 Hypothetical protein ERS024267_02046 [Mycobacterium tuberculosis]CKP42994.1 Hypothetical protein ERS024232_03879 [Mycobacterium tuberculosis]CKR01559.1 Hypothetical protein ERS027660_02033 [Mycobacterium tuberculosis]
MTYAARDDTTLPKLLAQMRWVVLVDKRQLAVLLLENEGPVASATDTLDTRGDSDYETSRSTQWSGYVGVWLTRRCVSGVLCRASSRSSDQVSTCG